MRWIALKLQSAIAPLIVAFIVPLAALAQVMISGGGGGAALSSANTWLAAQTFPQDGVKVADASGDLLTLSAGTQSVTGGKIQAPDLAGGTDTMITSGAFGQYFAAAKFWNNGTFYLSDTLGYVTLFRCNNQTGSYQVSLPTLAGNCNQQVGLSGTTSAMVAGAVSVANAGIHTGDIITMTRKSGGGTSSGIKTITINDGVGFDAVANDATDVGVWYWSSTRP